MATDRRCHRKRVSRRCQNQVVRSTCKGRPERFKHPSFAQDRANASASSWRAARLGALASRELESRPRSPRPPHFESATAAYSAPEASEASVRLAFWRFCGASCPLRCSRSLPWRDCALRARAIHNHAAKSHLSLPHNPLAALTGKGRSARRRHRSRRPTRLVRTTGGERKRSCDRPLRSFALVVLKGLGGRPAHRWSCRAYDLRRDLREGRLGAIAVDTEIRANRHQGIDRRMRPRVLRYPSLQLTQKLGKG